MLATVEEGGHLSKGWCTAPPTPNTSEQDLLRMEGRGAVCRCNSQLWQPSWNWSGGNLTSVILIVLSTVNQGWFVPVSLRQFSDLWLLTSCPQSGHCIVNFFHLVSVSIRQFLGYGSGYYLQPWRSHSRSLTLLNGYIIIIILCPLNVFLCFYISHFSD